MSQWSFAGALRRAGGQQFPDQRLRRPGGASAASPGCRRAVAGPERRAEQGGSLGIPS